MADSTSAGPRRCFGKRGLRLPKCGASRACHQLLFVSETS